MYPSGSLLGLSACERASVVVLPWFPVPTNDAAVRPKMKPMRVPHLSVPLPLPPISLRWLVKRSVVPKGICIPTGSSEQIPWVQIMVIASWGKAFPIIEVTSQGVASGSTTMRSETLLSPTFPLMT